MKDNDLNDVLTAVLDRVGKMPVKEADSFQDEPGDNVKGQGIFLGRWKCEPLKKVFNAYAAPEDLKTPEHQKAFLKYRDTVARMAELKDWHGYDGGSYRNFKEVFDAIAKDSYKGEWIIPPLSLLFGRDNGGRSIYEIIYWRKGPKAFKGSFGAEEFPNGENYPRNYWSSTFQTDSSPADNGVRVGFISETASYDYQKDDQWSCFCRPVRLVEIVSP